MPAAADAILDWTIIVSAAALSADNVVTTKIVPAAAAQPGALDGTTLVPAAAERHSLDHNSVHRRTAG